MTIRCLQMNIDNKGRGGAFHLIRQINTLYKDGDIEFDYLTMDEFVTTGNPNIDVLPNSITYSARYRSNKLFGLFKLPFFVSNVLKEHDYRIVHINSDSSWKALMFAIPSRLKGVKTIIVHSHSIAMDGSFKFLKTTLHRLFKPILQNFIDVSIACSNEAAEWMFSGKNLTNCHILFNGINIDSYKFNYNERNRLRKVLGLSDYFVIGCVGVISVTKNQLFQLDILEKILHFAPKTKLILIGDCSNKWKVKLTNKIKKLHLNENVIIYGKSDNVPEMLMVLDQYWQPSLFEGFSISLLEAQASGLPCLISDVIPNISTVSTLVKKVSLSKNSEYWASKSMQLRKYCMDRATIEINQEFDVSHTANELRKIYINSIS